MATNTVYKTAGLPVAKNAGQAPGSGANTAYKTAGFPPVVLTAGVTGALAQTLGAVGAAGAGKAVVAGAA